MSRTYRPLFITLCALAAACVSLAAATAGKRPAAASAAQTNAAALTLEATTSVTYNPDAGLYTYEYTFRNATDSSLEASSILIPANGSSVLNPVAPQGWTALVWDDGTTVDFAATEGVEPPPGFVDEGQILPSPFQIKPGQTVGGFSFQSPDPPEFIEFYALGFKPIPVLGVDVPEVAEDVPPPSVFDQSFRGRAKGPRFTETLFTGGRRPAVDGFLVFRSIAGGDTKPAPVQVDVEFSANGETVNQSSFKATLNNQDVTSAFKPTGPNSMRAVFSPDVSPLKLGRNVLLTTVSGLVPGRGRTASDVDRVTFTVVQ